MPQDDPAPVRIAAAQLAGLSRQRTVVAAPPFTALLTPGAGAYANYAVIATPGRRVDDLGDSLATLRAAFAPDPPRFELVDEAGPGAVEALLAAGAQETGRYAVLTLDASAPVMPDAPPGASVEVVRSAAQAREAQQVANAAFRMEIASDPGVPGEPPEGGCALVRLGGRAVSVAYWTAVADGVTEIAGVATLPDVRGRGLGTFVTASAVRSACELAGVTLAWLTPGGEGADRVYRRVGFQPTAHAVHLSLPN